MKNSQSRNRKESGIEKHPILHHSFSILHSNSRSEFGEGVHIALLVREGDLGIRPAHARHDVEVKVMDSLPGCRTVVLQYVEAITGQSRLEVRGNLLDAHDDFLQNLRRRVEQPRRVFLGDHERVAEGKRIDVKVGQHEIILIDLERGNLTGGNGTENAVVLHFITPFIIVPKLYKNILVISTIDEQKIFRYSISQLYCHLTAFSVILI